MLLDQQVYIIEPIGLTNRWETHKFISDDRVEWV